MRPAITAIVLSLMALAVTGCESSTPRPSASSPARPTDAPGITADTPISEAGKKAEQVQSAISQQLDSYFTRYGEGTNSPCAPADKRLFTDTCRKAGESLQTIAQAALKEIEGSKGFHTLREQAQVTARAFSGYQKANCSTNPQATKARSLCVRYGSDLAQAPSNLRDGINLGLAGK
ncbi:hypothetical protein [Streptomyces sp. BPTC-684]|uniref:hypothetical protein n=1 Tax=Streptomyces sp. BPTC-684 TaxID=3043734 RepID=UPI0024B03FFE|nr:hypothetical protein [Streptomyces sp. BPTC-684]WHM37435.1 hypothetical protein QIY60_11315 [Streptomyces sp. BPTC-684]